MEARAELLGNENHDIKIGELKTQTAMKQERQEIFRTTQELVCSPNYFR
jgi:hypothetical protein